MTLSEFLKEERLKRCLTQKEMAELIGVSRSVYNLYEKGNTYYNGKVRVPTIAVRKRIAIVTQKTPTFINDLIKNSRGKEERD